MAGCRKFFVFFLVFWIEMVQILFSKNNKMPNFILNTGIGIGSTVVGTYKPDVSDPSSAKLDLGSGFGYGLNLQALYNYDLYGFEVSSIYSYVGNTEISHLVFSGTNLQTREPIYEDKDFTYNGNGNFFLLDTKVGLKIFTEPDDMGYTFLYTGFRFWTFSYSYNSYKIEDGVNYSDVDSGFSMTGYGWLLGFRDFSTIKISDELSLVFEFSVFMNSAPSYYIKEKLYGETTYIDFDKRVGISYGFDTGIGIAFEKKGFAIFLSRKDDVILSLCEYDTGLSYPNNKGYNGGAVGTQQFYILATKQFSIF